MKQKLIYASAIIYVLSIYLTIYYYLTHTITHTILCIPILFALVNTLATYINKDQAPSTPFLYATILVKYTLIPLYLLGGFVNVLLFLLAFIPVPFMFMLSPALITILSFFGWIYMLGTLPFSLTYIKRSKENKTHAPTLCTIATICQFFFVLDTIAIMILAFKEKKCLTITKLFMILLLLAFAFLFIFI